MNYEEYIKKDLPVVSVYDNKYENYEWDELNILGETNDPVALYEIGNRYCNGIKVEKDEEKAVEYFERVLNLQKNTMAMCEIGRYYLFKEDFDEQKKSMDYFKAGSECGDGKCTRRLGDLYCFGKGVETDYEKAKELYLQAIDQGEVYANINIGCVYAAEGEYDKALGYFQTGYAQTEGEEKAEFAYRIAQIYWNNDELEEDYDKLFQFLQEATKSDFKKEANGMLCYCYAYGKGTEQNTEKAIECLDDICEVDRPACTYICGNILRMENRPEEALPYLQEAANLGYEDAMKLMDEKSTDQEYLAKRSEEGSAIAMAKLAILLVSSGNRESCLKGFELAQKAYELAIQDGSPVVMAKMAMILIPSGDGNPCLQGFSLARNAYELDENNSVVKMSFCHVTMKEAHYDKEAGKIGSAYEKYMEVIPMMEQLDTEGNLSEELKNSLNKAYYEVGQLAWADKKEDVALSLLKKADPDKYPYAVVMIANIHFQNYRESLTEGSTPRSKELDQDIVDLKRILDSENFESDFQKAHACLTLSTIYQIYKEGNKEAYEEGYRLCQKAYALDPELAEDMLNIYLNELNADQELTDSNNIKNSNADNNENEDNVDATKKGVNINIIVIVCILVFMIILIKYGLDQTFDNSQLPPATASPTPSVDTSSEVNSTQSQTESRESINRIVATVEGGASLNGENDIVVVESVDSTTSEVNPFTVADPDDLYIVDSVSNREELIGLLNLIAYEFSNSYKYDDIQSEQQVINYLISGIWVFYDCVDYFGTYKDDLLRTNCEYHGEFDNTYDPLNKFRNSYGSEFYQYDVNEIEKTAMDVFNCNKNDLAAIRDINNDDWTYYYDGYYYQVSGDGYVEVDNVDIIGILTDGHLYYVFYNYFDYDYDEYMEDPENYISPLEQHFAIVEQKEDQGRSYWSIYETDNMIERGVGDKIFARLWN